MAVQLFEDKLKEGQPIPEDQHKYYPMIHTTPIDNRTHIDDVTWNDYQNMPDSWKRTYLYGKWPVELNKRDVFPMSWISQAIPNARTFLSNVQPEKYETFYKLGIDPGINVLTMWLMKAYKDKQTGKQYDLAEEKIQEYGITDDLAAEKIDELMENYDIKDEHVGIDSAGVQIIKHLKENYNRNIVGISGGLKPIYLPETEPHQFNNLRSQMHWYARVGFEHGTLMLNLEKTDYGLETNLLAIELEDSNKAILKIAEKSVFKKKLKGKSTDDSDPLLYAYIVDRLNSVQGIIEVKCFKPIKISTQPAKITSLWL